MRLLFYNWTQYDDPERRGGGIRVYQQNLIDHLVHHTDHEVTVLSSGLEHDVVNTRVRIKETSNSHPDRVRSFTFVNSPILAPGHHSFGNPKLFDEGEMFDVWHDFLERHGPFDVIQFDSLEGIPFTLLRVHEQHPNTKVIVYAHNYYAVCPQVNLWKQERLHCADFEQGQGCVSCIPSLVRPTDVVRAHRLSRLIRSTGVRPGTLPYRLAYAIYARLRRIYSWRHQVRTLLARLRRRPSRRQTAVIPVPAVEPVSMRQSPEVYLRTTHGDAPLFVERRERALDLINNNADIVLATSRQGAEVLRYRGIADHKLEVTYIGTRAAETVDKTKRRSKLLESGRLTIAYLGYIRPDKGFFFLLETLENCPKELLSRIRLVLGARAGDEFTMTRLATLAQTMQDIVFYDGYTHDQLPTILESVDFGIVPVQWEDTLPQVAIEMVANGVPLITSNRGGAQELGESNRSFVFAAENPNELIDILRNVVDGKLEPRDYWEHARELVTMDHHVARLTELYEVDNAQMSA